MIARHVIRARTLRRFRGVLQTLKLPPLCRRVIKVPTEIPRLSVKKFLFDSLADLRCARPSCFVWVWEQTISTSRRQRTLSSVSWGAIAACKVADAVNLLSSPSGCGLNAADLGAPHPKGAARGKTDAIGNSSVYGHTTNCRMQFVPWFVFGELPCQESACR